MNAVAKYLVANSLLLFTALTHTAPQIVSDPSVSSKLPTDARCNHLQVQHFARATRNNSPTDASHSSKSHSSTAIQL